MSGHEWSSTTYVTSWAARDDKEALFRLPWELSTDLVRDDMGAPGHVIDLGAGPGGFLETFLAVFPDATGTWVDSSEPMLELARDRLAAQTPRVEFVLGDASQPRLLGLGPADVVTSSRMIHHFTSDRIHDLYQEVHDHLLRPGGWFFNLDHFGAPADFEARYRRVRARRRGRPRRSGSGHVHDAPFSLLTEHARWLTDVGFSVADFPWRTLYTALLVAQRS